MGFVPYRSLNQPTPLRSLKPIAASFPTKAMTLASTTTRLWNFYDDWRYDLLSTTQSAYTYDDLILPLDEDSIELCLEEFMDSDYGKTMFGRHDLPASVG